MSSCDIFCIKNFIHTQFHYVELFHHVIYFEYFVIYSQLQLLQHELPSSRIWDQNAMRTTWQIVLRFKWWCMPFTGKLELTIGKKLSQSYDDWTPWLIIIPFFYISALRLLCMIFKMRMRVTLRDLEISKLGANFKIGGQFLNRYAILKCSNCATQFHKSRGTYVHAHLLTCTI